MTKNIITQNRWFTYSLIILVAYARSIECSTEFRGGPLAPVTSVQTLFNTCEENIQKIKQIGLKANLAEKSKQLDNQFSDLYSKKLQLRNQRDKQKKFLDDIIQRHKEENKILEAVMPECLTFYKWLFPKNFHSILKIIKQIDDYNSGQGGDRSQIDEARQKMICSMDEKLQGLVKFKNQIAKLDTGKNYENLWEENDFTGKAFLAVIKENQKYARNVQCLVTKGFILRKQMSTNLKMNNDSNKNKEQRNEASSFSVGYFFFAASITIGSYAIKKFAPEVFKEYISQIFNVKDLSM